MEGLWTLQYLLTRMLISTISSRRRIVKIDIVRISGIRLSICGDLDNYVSSHLVDVGNLRADNFDAYSIARAKSLLGIISKAMGKNIPNLGGEEVVTSFGDSLE